MDLAINNPLVEVAVLGGVGDEYWLEVMVIFEAGVHVGIPVELVHDEVEVLALVFWHILDQETPRDVSALDHALVHAEDVAAPLRFVSAKAAGRMEDGGPDQPAGAWLEPIRFGEIQNPVVALVPVFQAFSDLGFGGAGLEAKECVREIIAKIVMLWWKVVRLGFALETDQLGLLGA